MSQIERRIISELKKGSKDAFDKIYQMYSKRLYIYCYQYTKNKETTEEIIQDVFVRIWFNREKIRQDESLKALLFIMVKNHIINAYKANLNSPIYEDYIEVKSEYSINNTHHQIEYEEFLNLVMNELKKLPMTQQSVIKLSRFENLSNKEISIKLGLSEQTIKNQLSIGLKALKDLLSNHVFMLFILLFC